MEDLPDFDICTNCQHQRNLHYATMNKCIGWTVALKPGTEDMTHAFCTCTAFVEVTENVT